MTHPSPGGSTSAGAAPLQTPPPRWACAGRCLHRASRSNYSPTCTCERTATPYSQPAGRTKSIISTFFLLCNLVFFFLNKMIQLKQSWHHLSRRHKKDLMGCFSTRGTKSLASIILFSYWEDVYSFTPVGGGLSWESWFLFVFGALFDCVRLTKQWDQSPAPH